MKNDSKILVIGESCVDIFNYGTCVRLCPDVPAPVVNSVKVLKNVGMAGNVKENISAMKGNVEIYTNENWEKITKTRFVEISGNYVFMRLDDENHGYGRANVKSINFNKYDAIIISDYNKGFLSKEDIRYIINNHPLVFIDTKKPVGDWCKEASFIKINNSEYQKSIDYISKDLKNKLIVTLGKKGCSYKGNIYPVPEVEIKDLSGAGDTFLSGLVCEYLKTRNIDKAIQFANECATSVVQKRGVSTI